MNISAPGITDNISKMSSDTISSISSRMSSAILSDGSTDTSSGSWFDYIRNMSIMTWLIILMILAFFGFNVFVYLAKGTQDITDFFKPLIEKITAVVGGVSSKIVNVTAEGAKGVVNTTADVVDTGLTAVQDVTAIQPDNVQNSSLNKALNTSKQTKQTSSVYEADESNSKIQSGTPKSGWCYIGEDRGFRSCAKVGANDDCMSGDIFPTHEICVNPSLRA
jgi:hypothetical protein